MLIILTHTQLVLFSISNLLQAALCLPRLCLPQGLEPTSKFSLGTRQKTQSRSSLDAARVARTKKRGLDLDPPIHTRGPIVFPPQFYCFHLFLESKFFFVLAAF